jgi:L-asparagine transporter-like permease
MVKGLSAWQLTMMGLGTVVGGSFFLGVAVAIQTTGPSIILSYVLGGAIVYVILFSLSEMTVADPTPGSFRTFAERSYGPSLGFLVGWVYWTGLILAMSSEAIAVGLLLRGWFPGISLLVIGSVIIIGVTLLNLLGAEKLSKLESGLAAVKLLAIVAFIILGLLIIIGLFPGTPRVGIGNLVEIPFFAGGIGGIAGSMLIVMFTYAGFEIIGLAASETNDPSRTIPKAIRNTVVGLVSLYVFAIVILLPLIPIASITADVSPFVAALSLHGLGWVGTTLSYVLVTAILSTMLAATFGLGRMIRSLADEGQAPSWIKGIGDTPFRGILFSGAAMLAGLGLGLFLPEQIYLFLISSGGFSLLFTYVVIVASHIKFRKVNGCPGKGRCQLPGYPFTSWFALISLVAIIVSMPLIPGQGAGLAAGISLLVFYTLIYLTVKVRYNAKNQVREKRSFHVGALQPQANMEASEELLPKKEDKQ